MTATQHTLRTNIAFALNLADSFGLTVQTISANEWGEVTLFCWNDGFDRVAGIADGEGWPEEIREGEGWRSRHQTFDIDGHRVEIDIVGAPAEVSA